MWMDGDVYRSKQPRPRLYPERDLAYLISSLDDVSLSSSVNAKGMDEVLRFRRRLRLLSVLTLSVLLTLLIHLIYFVPHRMTSWTTTWA